VGKSRSIHENRLLHHDVFGLEVTVDDVALVRGDERADDRHLTGAVS